MSANTMIEPVNVANLFDEQIEASVLGALLVKSDYMRILDLMPADFYLLRHQHIFSAMKSVDAEHAAIDRATVRKKLQDHGLFDLIGGENYLTDITTRATTGNNVRVYAELVKRDAIRRRGLQAIDNMSCYIQDKGMSVEEVVANMQAELQSVREGIGANTLKSSTQLTEEIFTLLDHKEAGVIPLGFPRLDRNLGGGIRRGNVAVFAAPSGVGKTWFAINAAVNIARQKRTDGRQQRILYFTLEMTTAREFNPRLVGVVSHEPDKQAITTTAAEAAGKHVKGNKALHSRFSEVALEIESFDLFVDERASITPAYIRDKVMLHKPDVVIVDYLTLMHDDGSHYSRHTEYSAVIKALKEIAKESGDTPTNQAAFLVLAQLNRESIKSARDRGEPPYKEAIKESGDIENHSAQIVMLWQNDDMESNDVIGFAVRKNRYGDEYKGEYRTRPPACYRDPHTGKMVETTVSLEDK